MNFKSIFETVLRSCLPGRFSSAYEKHGTQMGEPRSPTVVEMHKTTPTDPLPPGFLQSEGGSNRFLGISAKDGKLYSVGRRRDSFGRYHEEWLEWRPFIIESISTHFPDATFIVESSSTTNRVKYEGLESALASAFETIGEPEIDDLAVSVEVSKGSVLAVLIQVVEAVADLHGNGYIHGDLKPANVLLPVSSVFLIDDFRLCPGQPAPGFTPDWSAPEQVLGDVVSHASDVYPIGRMIVELLGATLVGEVRKFKLAKEEGAQTEFDVFYNPSVRRVLDESILSGEGLVSWGAVARRCLRFEPAERYQDVRSLAKDMAALMNEYPLGGVCHFPIRHKFALAAFADGDVRVAHVIPAAPPARSHRSL
jgi:serine/threonine protein kinase